MKISKEIIKYIDQSVLCWLATSSAKNVPNVSPKEIFSNFGNDSIIIANIASPQSIRNIKENNKVCISLVDVLVQKGFQLHGTATIHNKKDADYEAMEQVILKMTEGKFPFASIIKVTIENAKKILAPSYIFYPETTETQQIESAKKVYGLNYKMQTFMKRKHISSGSSFETEIGYSRAVVDDNWIFVSGTTGFDYSNMTIDEDIVVQTEQCFLNIKDALEKADSGLKDVVRVLYIVPEAAQFEKCWPILRKYLGDVKPAATMISAGLADPRMKIEIEVTAKKHG